MGSVPDTGGRFLEWNCLPCPINCTIAGKPGYANTEIQKLLLQPD